MSSPETLAANVALWTKANAEHTDAAAARAWSREEMSWGVFNVPESSVGAIGDVAGLDVVELGCGTAYWSAWLARAGARPVGVDITPAQLDTARRCMDETGIRFPLVEADAGATGLPDESADLVLSEYGASIWVDPYRWIPEAARLLCPGGRLVFLCNSTLTILTIPDEEGPTTTSLQRPQRGMNRFAWPDGGVEFHIGHGERIDLLRANGFTIDRLIELYAPEDAKEHEYYVIAELDWAKQWPSEEIWACTKTPIA
ncbi:MAG: class I SAM-dependent methyltransferase [Actinobacteria bacterium]|nr:class I SAM-dependent methyltransferase [Actinomycetota bacterium]